MVTYLPPSLPTLNATSERAERFDRVLVPPLFQFPWGEEGLRPFLDPHAHRIEDEGETPAPYTLVNCESLMKAFPVPHQGFVCDLQLAIAEPLKLEVLKCEDSVLGFKAL